MQGAQPLDWHPVWGTGNGAAPQFSLFPAAEGGISNEGKQSSKTSSIG